MCKGRRLLILYFQNKREARKGELITKPVFTSLVGNWPCTLSKIFALADDRSYYEILPKGRPSKVVESEEINPPRWVAEVEKILETTPLPDLNTTAQNVRSVEKDQVPEWISTTRVWQVAKEIDSQDPKTLEYNMTIVYACPL